jgi:DNA repair protein RecO (recombination protein O)
MSAPRRVALEPAFLLHHRPWSDTSRILELMTRRHGRVTLFARGARRPGSALRGVLQPFVPMLISWSGKADGGTLVGAEIGGTPVRLPPSRLMCGFYLNELLLRLLPHEEGHDRLFDAYATALGQLAAAPDYRPLRTFELVLLEEMGYGLELGRDAASGEPLDPERYYHFQPGRGVLAVASESGGPEAFRGRDMLAVACGEFDEPAVQSAARRILGAAIGHCLEGRGLHSRDVMLALRQREQDA